MNLKSTVFIHVLIGITLPENEVSGHTCYVCGEDGELSCENFETDKDTYISECNPSYKGCLTTTKGSQKIRSCVPKKLEDCKVANGVEYCFCSTDLCNGLSGKFMTTDDEDLLEGSGIKMIPPITEPTNETVKAISSGLSTAISRSLFLIPIFCIIYK